MIDYPALKAAILSNPDCQPYIVTNDMPSQDAYSKDLAIADLFNQSTGTRLVERFVTAIGVMSALGVSTGATILEKMDAAKASFPALKWVMVALSGTEGVNVGDSESQVMLDALANAGVLTQQECDSVKALAVKPSSLAYQVVGQEITAADVSIALRNY